MDAVASVSCKDVHGVKKGEGNQGGETYDCCRDIAMYAPSCVFDWRCTDAHVAQSRPGTCAEVQVCASRCTDHSLRGGRRQRACRVSSPLRSCWRVRCEGGALRTLVWVRAGTRTRACSQGASAVNMVPDELSIRVDIELGGRMERRASEAAAEAVSWRGRTPDRALPRCVQTHQSECASGDLPDLDRDPGCEPARCTRTRTRTRTRARARSVSAVDGVLDEPW